MGMSAVEPPPEAFNFAAHLLGANAGRPGKTAFIDDAGAVTYGELDERARRFAAALKERGVKREERVLILMQDGADWPVAFLGAMLAGVVPVASEHPAHRRRPRLHARALARPGRFRERRGQAGAEGGAGQIGS